MNFILRNRELLQEQNYILKGDRSTDYWVGISKRVIDSYVESHGDNFNIIIFGNPHSETDYYVIPYNYISDILIPENMTEGRERWVADIKNHIISFRKSSITRNVSEFYSIPVVLERGSIQSLTDEQKNDYSIENAKREISVRLKQSKFRIEVLRNFDSRCCICGVSEADLLVASHIIPWSEKLSTRLDPRNGLCLFFVYDKLFDKGYFTLDDELKVIVSNKENLSVSILKILKAIEGEKISETISHNISLEALKHHREIIFLK